MTGALLDDGFDVAYAYKPLHEPGLGHAFLNTLLYLDYDRKGFDYPVIPFAVNCYGSRIIRNRGGASPLVVNGVEMAADPPSPSPKRCMELGAAAARAMRGESLARGADRVVKLVSRLLDREKLVALLRR